MHEDQQLHSSYLVSCILNAFLCYTAILLNIVTIQAMRKTSSLSKTLKTLLLSLAVSNLGVGLLVQPLFIALCTMDLKQINNFDDPIYNATYIAYLISVYSFAFTSFLGVMALITDRFLAIHLHLRYQELVTHKRVIAVVIFTWVFSATFSLIRVSIQKNVFYGIVCSVVFACIIVTTFISVKICLNVRRHMNQIQGLQVNQVAQNGEMANIVKLRKFAIAAVYVYLVFVVYYLPKICIVFAVLFISGKTDEKRLQIYDLYFTTLLFLNSSLNPLVYSWKMKHIRQTIMDILRNAFLSHN